MAIFLTTHATAYNIENIILDSKKELVLVSPYLNLSKTFFDRLMDADERGVKTVIIYGKDELKASEKNQLKKLKNLSLFFCENLHAKCYFNEDQMVITSMNMYEFSEKNNREMGILIKRQEDTTVFDAALREAQSIVKSSVKEDNKTSTYYQQPIPKTERSKKNTPSNNVEKSSLKNILMGTLSTMLAGEKLDAYCIRCRERISDDSFRPLCDECYETWSEYGNPSYPEHYCHFCGKESKTSKDKPLCSTCFKKYG
ncbi:phospholipase D family protein [Chloroflexota bacterium]